MNRAQIILPVSHYLRQAIEAYGIRNTFSVVPNVVDTDIFYPAQRVTRNRTKKILMVARLSPIKGLPYLLEALAQLKENRQDFILEIVGDGPNRQEYEELVKTLNLDEKVVFKGLRTKREVPEFMRQCDFMVQPSLFETFGVSYLEAMACGKPVIATDMPVLREKINTDRGILVPSGDSEALAEAIDRMLDHYQDYSLIKISEYVTAKFRYPVVGQAYDSIYKRLTGTV